MRLIAEKDIEQIALGATFLGSGGGGDPYLGKMMALSAVETLGPVTLLSIDEIDDQAYYIPPAMLGAPSVIAEKFPKGDEFIRVFQKLQNYLGIKSIGGAFPIEAGGINSMVPIVVAAQLDLPLIDVDSMGRAFPEVQMTTFHLNGLASSPMGITDEKGNVGILETISNKWSETFARTLAIQMGASSLISIYPCQGWQLKAYGIPHIITLSQEIGKIIQKAPSNLTASLKELLGITQGFELFIGKISDIKREVKEGFNVGTIIIHGLDNFSGQHLEIYFQNEQLIATLNNTPIATTPDLINLVDVETLFPLTTESLKYGKRVRVIGMPAAHQWRTPKGIETVGPRYFGYDLDYVPLEELVRRQRNV